MRPEEIYAIGPGSQGIRQEGVAIHKARAHMKDECWPCSHEVSSVLQHARQKPRTFFSGSNTVTLLDRKSETFCVKKAPTTESMMDPPHVKLRRLSPRTILQPGWGDRGQGVGRTGRASAAGRCRSAQWQVGCAERPLQHS